MLARLACWLGFHDLFKNTQKTNPWGTNHTDVLSCSRCPFFKKFEPVDCGWQLPPPATVDDIKAANQRRESK